MGIGEIALGVFFVLFALLTLMTFTLVFLAMAKVLKQLWFMDGREVFGNKSSPDQKKN